jgi:hypothetical protein
MTTSIVGGSKRSTENLDDVLRTMDDFDSNELRFENDERADWRNSAVARQELENSEYEQYEYEEESSGLNGGMPSSRENSRKKYIQSQMLSYKQQGSFDLPEDVYSFITVAPFCSFPFLFACGVIGIKYVVYATLLSKITREEFSYDDEKIATAVKFFLIPVTVAMQEDLMAVYTGLANARYDPKVLEISEAATKAKFSLAYILQLIDGLLSLSVNFLKMFSTSDIMEVFLNFAALHFLQDIDDVFYALVEKGFFGDDMEHMATVCKQISWPRRTGSTPFSKFMTKLDSILFGTTFLICVILFIVITVNLILQDESSSTT